MDKKIEVNIFFVGSNGKECVFSLTQQEIVNLNNSMGLGKTFSATDNLGDHCVINTKNIEMISYGKIPQ